MKRVHICPNQFRDGWTIAEVDNVDAFLAWQFESFPEFARIYHGSVAQQNDVTPIDERGFRHLQALEGDFYVVLAPAYDPLTIAYLVIAAITLAFSVYTYMTMPKPNIQAVQSPNNDAANRQNQIRLGGRVPEFFGEGMITPDMISQPYIYYDKDGNEMEEWLGCATRGYLDVHYVRDNETNVLDIPGMSVSFYDPNTSIIGDAVFSVGDKFIEPPLHTVKCENINGQQLEKPNEFKLESDDIYFVYPNLIRTKDSTDFQQSFAAGNVISVSSDVEFGVSDVILSGVISVRSTGSSKSIIIESHINVDLPNDFKLATLSNATTTLVTKNDDQTENIELLYFSGKYLINNVQKTILSDRYHYEIVLNSPTDVNPAWSRIFDHDLLLNGSPEVVLSQNSRSLNLSGIYEVLAVTTKEIQLKAPESVNKDWMNLVNTPSQSTINNQAMVRLDLINAQWLGWLNSSEIDATQIIFNFQYPNGIYWQSRSGRQDPDWSDIEIQYQQIIEGEPFGKIYTYNDYYRGKNTNEFGRTVKVDLPFTGRFRFRLCNNRDEDVNARSQVKVKEIYAAQVSDVLTYPWTVLRCKSVGTKGATSYKQKKLNAYVTRKLEQDGTGELVATKSADQALIWLALDKINGRREPHEIDIEQIKAEIEKVNTYFGTAAASEFTYTIDDENLSFEEIAGMVASSVFCEPNRYGSKLQLKFEQPQENAVLLFNHRNKVPQSEKRTENWGVKNKYDGVEVE